ncbi:MAG: DsbA family protein [Chloroflexi bacterium]|nr:DsbA family protein [Chloroflexota bacterium]
MGRHCARLLTDETQAEVEAEAEHAHELGITGVPFFILNQKYAFSGAQPPERIVRVLQQASQGG